MFLSFTRRKFTHNYPNNRQDVVENTATATITILVFLGFYPVFLYLCRQV